MAIKWWALQDVGDREPFAVMSVDDADGLPRRFVPGEGLVHWPSLSMYVVGGEPGARPINETEAVRLMDEGVGEIEPGYVALGRGQGETTQPPTSGNDPVAPADDEDRAALDAPQAKPTDPAAAKPTT